MTPWFITFNDVFWIGLAGLLVGAVVKLVSKCRTLQCCGFRADFIPPQERPNVNRAGSQASSVTGELPQINNTGNDATEMEFLNSAAPL